MDNRAIGVFDSGVGGLSAARVLLETAPEENIVYFGDTANVPYGSRSLEEITGLSVRDMNFMRTNDLKCVLIACNTITAACGPLLQRQNTDIPVLGVIAPAAETAAAASKNGKIAVMGTEATVKSGEYEKQLKMIRPELEVFSIGCPKLVPLIENGHIAFCDELINEALDEYLQPIKAMGADTLILGCTHYPLIAPIVQSKMGESVTLIDSGGVAARAVLMRLKETDSLSEAGGRGAAKFYCSAKEETFARVAEIFLGRDISGDLAKTDIEKY